MYSELTYSVKLWGIYIIPLASILDAFVDIIDVRYHIIIAITLIATVTPG